MNTQMSQGFQDGAGLNPDRMQLTLSLIGSGVVLLVFGWIVLQMFVAYKDERLALGDAIWGGTKVCILLGIVFFVVFR